MVAGCFGRRPLSEIQAAVRLGARPLDFLGFPGTDGRCPGTAVPWCGSGRCQAGPLEVRWGCLCVSGAIRAGNSRPRSVSAAGLKVLLASQAGWMLVVCFAGYQGGPGAFLSTGMAPVSADDGCCRNRGPGPCPAGRPQPLLAGRSHCWHNGRTTLLPVSS